MQSLKMFVWLSSIGGIMFIEEGSVLPMESIALKYKIVAVASI